MNEKIIALLESKNVKATAVRILVLDVFMNIDHALALNDLEKILPWSDRASLFRSLKTFEANGIIHKVNDGDRSAKYALCSEHCSIDHHHVHPHFHCTKCGKTLCLSRQNIKIPNIPQGFIANDYSLIINGTCANCASAF